MRKARPIRDEALIRGLLLGGAWLEFGRITKRVHVVRDKNDPGDLVDKSVFERLEKANLIKRGKISQGITIWTASAELLSSKSVR